MIKDKLYILKKYIFAKNLAEVIKKEKDVTPDDIWIDEDWRKNMMEAEKKIGFKNEK